MRERWLYRKWMWSVVGPWLAPSLTFVLCTLAILLERLEASARLPLVAAALAVLFFDQRHRLEANKLLREITKSCNDRYQQDWSTLQDAATGHVTGKAQGEAFTKYLNLCAEEYLYWSLGLLHPDVWGAWRDGMRLTFNSSDALSTFALRELRAGSYYGLTPEIVGISGQSSPPTGLPPQEA